MTKIKSSIKEEGYGRKDYICILINYIGLFIL